jgi:uncharacterized membrane protein
MKRSAYLAAALGITLVGAPAWADDVPKFDIKATCRGVAANGTEDTSRGCEASEQDARAQLERRWTSFKPDSRRVCTQETQIGGSPSYVEVLTCVEMAEGTLMPTGSAGGLGADQQQSGAGQQPATGQQPAAGRAPAAR